MWNALLRLAQAMRQVEAQSGLPSGRILSHADQIEKLAEEGKDCEQADRQRISKLERMLHEVAPCPQCGLDEAYPVRAATEFGTMWVCGGCSHQSGLAKWPRRHVTVIKAGTEL